MALRFETFNGYMANHYPDGLRVRIRKLTEGLSEVWFMDSDLIVTTTPLNPREPVTWWSALVSSLALFENLPEDQKINLGRMFGRDLGLIRELAGKALRGAAFFGRVEGVPGYKEVRDAQRKKPPQGK